MKISIFFLVIVLSLFYCGTVFAHPGNTAADGCHYCWTNCDYWGYVYGTRHCHGGSTFSYPSYSAPSIPSCPSHSAYSYLSSSCKCNYGYVANSSGTGCISEDDYCENDDKE